MSKKIRNYIDRLKTIETYLIGLTNNRAYKLLQDLEDLKLIKVLKKDRKKKEMHKSNTAKYGGALQSSNEQYLDFQQHAKDIRNEWQGRI